ncbi:MAG TPA: RluA family pseudouridine synthase [Nevskiaceae bacterium]
MKGAAPEASGGHRPAVREVVTAASAGQRIDNFLMARLRGVPKSHIYRLLRSGQVRVDGGRAKPDRRLVEGQSVRIPPLRMAARDTRVTHVPAGLIARLHEGVVHEDDDYLALTKPAGIAAHAGSGIAFGVIEALRTEGRYPFLELAHRLDRDTSGILLLAKTRQALLRAQAAFRTGLARKRYRALLCGRLEEVRDVDAPLVSNRLVSGERRVQVDEGGRRAASRFTPREVFADATLCEVAIFSGRTHQIRVHALTIGHPVVGDRKYGERGQHAPFRELGLKRMFLHASSLELPATGAFAPLTLNSALPPELRSFLDALRAR